MRQMKTNDPGSIVVMLLTLILFVGAVLTKGFTHDLLLEAGVFLVSVKLIIMAYKNSVSTKEDTFRCKKDLISLFSMPCYRKSVMPPLSK